MHRHGLVLRGRRGSSLDWSSWDELTFWGKVLPSPSEMLYEQVGQSNHSITILSIGDEIGGEGKDAHLYSDAHVDSSRVEVSCLSLEALRVLENSPEHPTMEEEDHTSSVGPCQQSNPFQLWTLSTPQGAFPPQVAL